MPFVRRGDSARIYYEEYGRGYPVLLIAPGFLHSRIERWRTNPARPGVVQDWVDPTTALAADFRLIAVDLRNTGQSRGPARAGDDGWDVYARDFLAVLKHLGIARCHVYGACIGVSFVFRLAQTAPDLLSAMVLQNPIGLVPENRAVIDESLAGWVKEVGVFPEVDAAEAAEFGRRMFAGEFVFSVTRDFVRACKIPALLLPGDDVWHPEAISREIHRLAPGMERFYPWKGAARDQAMDRIRAFLRANTRAKA